MPTLSHATRALRTSGTGGGFDPSRVTPLLSAWTVAGTSQKSAPLPSTTCVPEYFGIVVHSAPPVLMGHVPPEPPAPAIPPVAPPPEPVDPPVEPAGPAPAKPPPPPDDMVPEEPLA